MHNLRTFHCRLLRPLLVMGVAFFLGIAQSLAQAPAPAPYKLRVVGGLAALSQFTRWEEPFWTQELKKLSGGKYSADIVPFDRAGVPGVEMLRLLQLGVIPSARRC